MVTQPRLQTIGMVRSTLRNHDRECSKYQLWKKLPKKTMYQTYSTILEFLMKNNEMVIDGNNKLSYIGTQKAGLKTIDRRSILYNLSHYGYDLISAEKARKAAIIPLEDLIIEILIRYPEARFIEAIPTLILHNKINQFELYRKSYEYGLINKIGFLLDVSCRLGNKNLKELLHQFKSKKEKKIQYFSSYKNKALLETPNIMKEWNLRGRFSLEDFRKND